MGDVVQLPYRIKMHAIPENFPRLASTCAASVYMHGKDVCIFTRYGRIYAPLNAWVLFCMGVMYVAPSPEDFDTLALP